MTIRINIITVILIHSYVLLVFKLEAFSTSGQSSNIKPHHAEWSRRHSAFPGKQWDAGRLSDSWADMV